MQNKPITMAGLARHLALNPSSVSRALDPARRHTISPEVVRRVEKAASQHGYRPNRAAATLRTGKSGCIGIVLPDITNPVFPPILRGIDDGLQRGGLLSLVANAAGTAQATQDLVLRMLGQGVDGLILATAVRNDPLIGLLAEAKVPVVLVNRTDEQSACSAVISDESWGMAQSVRHLLQQGHQRIGHLAGPQHLSTGAQRLQGFRTAMIRSDLDHRLTETCAGYSIEAGYRACQRLLARCARSGKNQLTAIVASNDLIALGAIDALTAAGMSVPDDVSLTGHNDMPFMDRIQPTLTTVRIQHNEMGQTAAQLLLQAIAQPVRTHTTIMLKPELVVRRSTGPAKHR